MKTENQDNKQDRNDDAAKKEQPLSDDQLKDVSAAIGLSARGRMLVNSWNRFWNGGRG